MWIDDEIISCCKEQIYIKCFKPDKSVIILGSSNKQHLEVNLENAEKDNIEILRRYGGGGCVLLYPGCLVVSIGCWVKDRYNNNIFFRLINQALCKSITDNFNIKNLTTKGISDIAYNDKKIAGTSLFRSRNYLLYQASILVDLDLELINTYLSQPSKEPDYRMNRSHSEFLTSLSTLDSKIKLEKLLQHFNQDLELNLRQYLNEQLIMPNEEQFDTLYKRIKNNP